MRLTLRRLGPLLVAASILAPARLIAAAAAPAAAEEATPDKSLGAAKEAFESAQNAFVRGEYAVAAERFLSAYEHKRYPAFLFNVAVSFEKAKQLEKAKQYFTKYLEQDADASDAAQVKLRLDVINQLLAPPPPPPAAATAAAAAGPDGGAPPAGPPTGRDARRRSAARTSAGRDATAAAAAQLRRCRC